MKYADIAKKWKNFNKWKTAYTLERISKMSPEERVNEYFAMVNAFYQLHPEEKGKICWDKIEYYKNLQKKFTSCKKH
ncbi:MAG: hypothetical protein J7J77_01835 [Candidatus Cloacimonetes bacterium]|nr:hypothetical protein [Candidatus Cloacimonadota bacterium]